MKRCVITLALAIMVAVPVFAQDAKPTVAKDVVATVNGESITAEQLDRLWNRMGAKMRAQYEKAGNGKLRFLENYVGKRLLLQLAEQTDFQQAPDIQAELEAAKEAALFDLYVREVVAAQVVTDAAVKKFYDDHPTDFVHPEGAKVRIITVSTEKRTDDEARSILGDLMKDLRGVRVGTGNSAQAVINAFAEAAVKNSEAPSAAAGGDLGWVSHDGLEPQIAVAVFNMKAGAVSGILETPKGMHLVLVEDRQDASTESFEAARAGIREYLVGANAQKVVEAVNRATRELRASSKVTLYPDNVR